MLAFVLRTYHRLSEEVVVVVKWLWYVCHPHSDSTFGLEPYLILVHNMPSLHQVFPYWTNNNSLSTLFVHQFGDIIEVKLDYHFEELNDFQTFMSIKFIVCFLCFIEKGMKWAIFINWPLTNKEGTRWSSPRENKNWKGYNAKLLTSHMYHNIWSLTLFMPPLLHDANSRDFSTYNALLPHPKTTLTPLWPYGMFIRLL